MSSKRELQRQPRLYLGMKRIGILSLLVCLGLLLAACGPDGSGSTSQNVPAGQMPLPNQELTRVAGAQGAAAPQAQQNQANPPAQRQPTATRRPANTAPPPASPTPSPIPPTQTSFPPTATSSPTFTPLPTEDVVLVAVAYHMPDGAWLRGTFYRPTSSDRDLPGVILLPMYVETSQSWETVARHLARRGFATLALDLRGQGESSPPADWQRSIEDVQNVVRAFADRQEVDGERIAVVAASNAANIALNAAAGEPSIRTLVLLSPGLNYRGIAANEPLAALQGRRIYVLASEDDPIAGDWPFRMQEMAQDRVILWAYRGDAHGTYLLAAQPGALNLIASWLNDELVALKIAEAPPPKRNFTPLLLFCLCVLVGGLFLLVAAGLAASLLRRSQLQGRPLTVAELRPGKSRLELRGQAARLSVGMGAAAERRRGMPLAVRLRVEAGGQGRALETASETAAETGRETRYDQTRMTPFVLTDTGGSLLVVPAVTGVRLRSGNAGRSDESGLPGGIRLSREQAGYWLQVFGIPELAAQPDVLHFFLWELVEGASVGVLGQAISLPYLKARQVGVRPSSQRATATTALSVARRAALLHGRLVEVFEPLDGNHDHPLALRRLVVEQEDPQYGWVILYDEVQAAPFRLEDGYGSAWVELDTQLLELDADPLELSEEEFRQQAGDVPLAGMSPERACRYLVYEIRRGDEVWTSGEVGEEKLLFNADELILNPSGLPLLPIASLKPGGGRVRVSGRILEITLPPGSRPGSSEAKTAWLRLRVEQPSPGGWETILDVHRAKPFRLEDASGSLWVDPTDAAPDAYGEGIPLNEQQADAILARLRRDLPAEAGMGLRFTLWERRVGESGEVCGIVTERPGPGGVPQPVLVLSSSRLSLLERLRAWKPLSRSR